ncbi:MAG: pyroglutamyl-peptidase I [Rhodoferax sp.]|nr:pyroglutamyl-peptidase I [Rhodoferax sp.]
MVTATPRILVTGFDPFGGAALNPSWLVAQALHGRRIAGHTVQAAQLPTVFGLSALRLGELLQQHRPALALCLGLAAGRAALSLERVAINVNDARIPDNHGAQPVDGPVVNGGPAAYFSNLPVKAMLQAIRNEGVAAELSNSAGTFVCNHVFYALMHQLVTQPGLRATRGGFLHLPCLPEQAAALSAPVGMGLADMVRGLQAGLQAALEHGAARDLQIAAGSTQ